MECLYNVVSYCFFQNFREKNSDLMQQDIIKLLKNSNFAFVREIIGELLV